MHAALTSSLAPNDKSASMLEQLQSTAVVGFDSPLTSVFNIRLYEDMRICGALTDTVMMLRLTQRGIEPLNVLQVLSAMQRFHRKSCHCLLQPFKRGFRPILSSNDLPADSSFG